MNPIFDPTRPTVPTSLAPSLLAADPTLSGTGDGGGGGGGGAPGTPGSPAAPGTPGAPAAPGGTQASVFDPSRYLHGGNVGNSAPGREQDLAWRPPGMQESARNQTYDQWRTEMSQRYPWMSDTSMLWGGGPEGYLPIDYQAQDYRYYQQPQGHNYIDRNGRISVMRSPGETLAPWESAFAQNTWNQNVNPNQAGYYDPQRVQNDPTYNPRA